jgi:hypothetical protein
VRAGTAVELVSIQKMAAVISETQQASQHDIADMTCRRLARGQHPYQISRVRRCCMKHSLVCRQSPAGRHDLQATRARRHPGKGLKAHMNQYVRDIFGEYAWRRHPGKG